MLGSTRSQDEQSRILRGFCVVCERFSRRWPRFPTRSAPSSWGPRLRELGTGSPKPPSPPLFCFLSTEHNFQGRNAPPVLSAAGCRSQTLQLKVEEQQETARHPPRDPCVCGAARGKWEEQPLSPQNREPCLVLPPSQTPRKAPSLPFSSRRTPARGTSWQQDPKFLPLGGEAGEAAAAPTLPLCSQARIAVLL